MRLFHSVVGHGPAVVILHGLFGSGNNWTTVARRLGAHHTVYLPDMRNHGRSPHNPLHTYRAMALDVQAFMAEQGIGGAAVIGHSMGGKTAMELALTSPEVVGALLVVDIAPSSGFGDTAAILESLNALDLTAIASRQEADAILAGRIPDGRVRQFLLTNLQRDDRGAMAWKINVGALARHSAELASPIAGGRVYKGETLFLRGQKSHYVGPTEEHIIRDLFPRATIETVPGAGHWVHADAPDAFMSQVERFLSEIGRKAGSLA